MDHVWLTILAAEIREQVNAAVDAVNRDLVERGIDASVGPFNGIVVVE